MIKIKSLHSDTLRTLIWSMTIAMHRFHFMFSVFFVLLGPIKIIPVFASLTHGKDRSFKSKSALLAVMFAAIMVIFIMFSADSLIGKYHIGLNSLKMSGGIVLLISALNTIFSPSSNIEKFSGDVSPARIAIAPLATPVIVTPAGVAALMTFVVASQQHPGMYETLWVVLAAIFVLDFLVMYFIDPVLKVPGFLPVLKLVGSVLIVVQVAGAVDLMIVTLIELGLFHR